MTAPLWPTTLPQMPLHDGFSMKNAPNIKRVQMADGPDKQRSGRKKAAPRPMSFLMTDQQLDTFLTFYDGQLVDGANPFKIADPRNAAEQLLLRFVTGYEATPRSSDPTDGIIWMLTCDLEVLP